MKKILIIEDNVTDASIMKDAFARGGLEAVVAHNGTDGLKMAGIEKPDLIILDLNLPDISGYEVCRILKQDPILKNIVVVIVSIKDQISEITEAIHAGAADYIIKPSNPDMLVNNVKLYLGIGG